jgi:hypothetical protein
MIAERFILLWPLWPTPLLTKLPPVELKATCNTCSHTEGDAGGNAEPMGTIEVSALLTGEINCGDLSSGQVNASDRVQIQLFIQRFTTYPPFCPSHLFTKRIIKRLVE